MSRRRQAASSQLGRRAPKQTTRFCLKPTRRGQTRMCRNIYYSELGLGQQSIYQLGSKPIVKRRCSQCVGIHLLTIANDALTGRQGFCIARISFPQCRCHLTFTRSGISLMSGCSQICQPIRESRHERRSVGRAIGFNY
jgi:hypothetical protein